METERERVLQDVSDIIRSVSLSRAAVETSTPEQIVHMTVRAIEENLVAYANGEPSNYRWFPQVYSLTSDIRRAVRESRMADRPKEQALRLIDQAASGWPA